ncbi:MAG: sortase [Anaerolineae bacterium]|nr:sortase [Anaerolineae bacterium]
MSKKTRRFYHTIPAVVLLVIVALVILLGCSSRSPAPRSLETPTALREAPTMLVMAPSPTPMPTAVPTPLASPTVAQHATRAQPASTPISATPTATPDSPPVRLIIPDLNIDVPVVEVAWQVAGSGDQRHSEWQTADHAAGHHVNSANPGQVGNVVISGHHNAKGRVFEQISRDIDRKEPRLKPGSKILVFTADGHQYTYRVEKILLLQEVGASEKERQQHAQWMAPTDEPVLTLVTCWPLWTNTHRVIVRARLEQAH